MLTDILTEDIRSLEKQRREQFEKEHESFMENYPEIVGWVNEVIDERFLIDLRSEFERRIEKSQAQSHRLEDLTVDNIIYANIDKEIRANVFRGEGLIYINPNYLKQLFDKKDGHKLRKSYVHEAVHVNSFTGRGKFDEGSISIGFSAGIGPVGTFLNECETDILAMLILENIDPGFSELEWGNLLSYHVDIIITLFELIAERLEVEIGMIFLAFEQMYFNGDLFKDEIYKIVLDTIGNDLWKEILTLHPTGEPIEKIERIVNTLESLKQHQH